jgi:hypothetical protein
MAVRLNKRANLIVAILVTLVGVGILGYLSTVLIYFPLFDWALTDIVWTREWLFMTIIDYYGAAFCLVVITFFNEPVLLAVVWSLGFCLLGSPVCCFYIVYR